jgi:hypothetical protein
MSSGGAVNLWIPELPYMRWWVLSVAGDLREERNGHEREVQDGGERSQPNCPYSNSKTIWANCKAKGETLQGKGKTPYPAQRWGFTPPHGPSTSGMGSHNPKGMGRGSLADRVALPVDQQPGVLQLWEIPIMRHPRALPRFFLP